MSHESFTNFMCPHALFSQAWLHIQSSVNKANTLIEQSLLPFDHYKGSDNQNSSTTVLIKSACT